MRYEFQGLLIIDSIDLEKQSREANREESSLSIAQDITAPLLAL